MSSITLRFKIPDEYDNFKWALNGPEYLRALEDFAEKLRSLTKYHDEKTSENDLKTLENVRTIFFEILREYDVKLYS